MVNGAGRGWGVAKNRENRLCVRLWEPLKWNNPDCWLTEKVVNSRRGWRGVELKYDTGKMVWICCSWKLP